MPAANSIDEVIGALTVIIEGAKAERSRLGYFPALYRRVTREVKRGIASGRFTGGAREVSNCWMLAFGAAERPGVAIIQHLLLGMNAHINLDLAAASAEAAPGNAILSLQRDFQQINKILSEQINLKTAVHPRQPRPAPMFTPPRAVLRNHPLGEARSSCAAQ